MDKEVLIHVRGLQTMDADGEQEPLEIVVPGQYYFRNGSHYLRYEEVMEDFAEPTVNYIKISRKDQCFRRIITQNHNLTFQDFLHSTIRTFRCLILRKRRIPHIFCQLFKHTAVKDSVNLKFFQPFLHFFQKSLMYQVVHV